MIGSDGCVTVHHESYYLSTHLASRKVALLVDAPTASFDVLDGDQVLKRLPPQKRGSWSYASGTVHLADAGAGPFRRAAQTCLGSAMATWGVGPHTVVDEKLVN